LPSSIAWGQRRQESTRNELRESGAIIAAIAPLWAKCTITAAIAPLWSKRIIAATIVLLRSRRTIAETREAPKRERNKKREKRRSAREIKSAKGA
jgi:beta-lactamase regulating signal transducer with metallopeptidase domain